MAEGLFSRGLFIRGVIVRMLGLLGVAALALFLLGLAPFFGAIPTEGAGLSGAGSAITVNRELKGDRLSKPAGLDTATPPVDFERVGSRQHRDIPVGCDAAFAAIFRRFWRTSSVAA